jgi:hypothetical protein
MTTPITTLCETEWALPPLILHPFNERVPPSTLLENSKAALMLSGLIPNDGSDREELNRRLLAGRCGEVRMLYFLGKDVLRWIGQCVEWSERVRELKSTDIQPQSFATLLTPVLENLSEEFLRNYHRYADALYRCYMDSQHFRHLASKTFRFELYASGEYSRMLESEWEANETRE